VHIGHLRPALELYERLSLERVLMIPSALPPHRDAPVVSAEQRLAMLQLAVAGEPALQVDARELQRAGPSYMVDTLHSLREEHGAARSLCLLLGVDAFLGLARWHRWEAILQQAHLVVAHRPGWQLPRGAAARGNPALLLLGSGEGDTPACLRERPAGCVVLQAVTQLAITATALRTAIAAGQSARYLLPEPVWHYIQHNNLYR
jgi:nicotinate-nucleotide adenylyltransferase